MQAYHHQQQHHAASPHLEMATSSPIRPRRRKGGAALIVVISLLGALAFLGFLFYSFAAQELASAEFFSQSETPTVPLPPKIFWDWSLPQIILGGDSTLVNSALSSDSSLGTSRGSRMSLIPNMIGQSNTDGTWGENATSTADVTPFDGRGMQVIVTGLNTGSGPQQFFIDLNGNGTFDAGDEPDETNFVMNMSAAALVNAPAVVRTIANNYRFATPDAGYTYPDINSPFLAYDAVVRGWADDGTGSIVNFPYRVVIPSYFRPQLFPNRRGSNSAAASNTDNGSNANGFEDLYTATATRWQVMRPHVSHLASDTPLVRRYISSFDPNFTVDIDGDSNADGVQAQSGDTNRVIGPFPFGVDLDGDGISNEMGIWTNPNQAVDGFRVNYELDVDTDGDGVRDAIWMDLDFPMMSGPDGRQFVPMFAVKIIDGDALLNLNAHGNTNGLFARLSDGTIEVMGNGGANGQGILTHMGPNAANEVDGYIHTSNLGMSRSEVNPSLGLTADATDPDERFNIENNFDFAVGSLTRPQVAQLELLMLLHGRRDFEKLRNNNVRETRNQILGRLGDRFRIRDYYRNRINSLSDGGDIPSPLPGGWAVDDDADSGFIGLAPFFGGMGDDDIDSPGNALVAGGGASFADNDLYGLWVPPFVHPLDYVGLGRESLRNTIFPGGSDLQRHLGSFTYTGGPDPNPNLWPDYDTGEPLNFWQHQNITGAPVLAGGDPLTGVLPWYTSLMGETGSLQPNPGAGSILYDFLIDDQDETILELSLRNPEYDAVHPTSELEGLHLSKSSFARIQGRSRARELASINFRDADDATRIRKRFTTDSWDRLEPSLQLEPRPGATLRDWERSAWTHATNGDFNSNGQATFPPEFPTGGVAGSAGDPFRLELRRLLRTEPVFTGGLTLDDRYPRHKLNITRILSDWSSPASGAAADERPAFDPERNPLFRNLTPHSAFESTDTQITTMADMHHDNVNAPPYAFETIDTSKEAREWWARYDRQRLARDIYTLLYTLAGPDSVDVFSGGYPTTVGTTDRDLHTYEPGQPFVASNGVNDLVEQMAQFAVNMVDALDRDDVVTRFEYDINLSDGWDTTAGGADLRVVNGVEAQQLSFSEALWIQTQEDPSMTPMDNPGTFWDDEDERQYLYIELRNSRPFDVDLGDETWQIARLDAAGTNDVATVTFEDDGTNRNVVKAGRTFIIAGHDNSTTGASGVAVSDFYIKRETADPQFTLYIPNRQGGANDPTPPTGPGDTTTEPASDLDLSYTNTGGDDQNRFTLASSISDGSGTLVHRADTETEMTLVLRRRRNLRALDRLDYPTPPALPSAPATPTDPWADWIEVDRITINRDTFTPPTGTPVGTDWDTAVGELQSLERSQPLARQDQNLHAIDAGGHSHSLGDPDFALNTRDDSTTNLQTLDRNQGNSNTSPTGFTAWQPHFDRDFSSVYELMSVALLRPEDLTLRLSNANGKLSGFDNTGLPSFAGSIFQSPDNGTTGNPDDDNRWFRLFELISVPDEAERAIRERLSEIVRTPGKINLNTLRQEEVLAGLIDDPFIMRFQLSDRIDDPEDFPTDTNGNFVQGGSGTNNVFGTTGVRNWMDELRLARDGIDPINYFPAIPANQVYVPLPGVPGVVADAGDTGGGNYDGTEGRPQLGAVPFRSLSYMPFLSENVATGASPAVITNVDPKSHSLLRNHTNPIYRAGVGEAINRETGLEAIGLFEARPQQDTTTDDYDIHTRNRLLAKIANNSTNRSNVFLCWIVVEFFEAHQAVPGDPATVQVGAKLQGSPTHRGFFVIDRTRLEQAVDEDSIVQDDGSANDTTEGRNDNFRFDWRDFVIHRRTIQ